MPHKIGDTAALAAASSASAGASASASASASVGRGAAQADPVGSVGSVGSVEGDSASAEQRNEYSKWKAGDVQQRSVAAARMAAADRGRQRVCR